VWSDRDDQVGQVVVGLGRKLNFGEIACPAYLLVGAVDDATTPEQVLDAAKYLGTPSDQIIKKTVPGDISAS
jgi:poly(3-hydroxyalkanoate) synthetase